MIEQEAVLEGAPFFKSASRSTNKQCEDGALLHKSQEVLSC